MRGILFLLLVLFCPVRGFAFTVTKDVVAVVMSEPALISYEALLENDVGSGLRVTDFRGLDADMGVLVQHEDYAEFQRTSNFLGHTSFEYEVTDSSGAIAWGSVFFCQGKAELVWGTGEKADNRIDFFFVGDGFTAPDLDGLGVYQRNTYAARVNDAVDVMFREPLSYWRSDQSMPSLRYKNWFNVYRVDVISNESGVSTEDTIIAGTAEVNDWLDTPFQAYKDYSVSSAGTLVDERTLYFRHNDRAQEVARQLVRAGGYDFGDNFDWGVLAANNNSRHNLGGNPPTWSIYDYVEIMIHEGGHGWHGLGDEYGGGGGALTSEPGYINVTMDSTGETKWGHWLGYDNPYDPMSVVGAYEGAMARNSGAWRPTGNSTMNSANGDADGFNAPSREKMIHDYHRRVHMLDGVLETDEVLYNPTNLWVDTVDPEVVKVDWLVDGVVQVKNGPESLEVGTLGLGAGVYSITARVYDEVVDHAFLSTNAVGSIVGFDPLDQVRQDLDKLEQWVRWDIAVTEHGVANLSLLDDEIQAGETFDVWVVDMTQSGMGEVVIRAVDATRDIETGIKLAEFFPGVFKGTVNTGIGAQLRGNGTLELPVSPERTIKVIYTDQAGAKKKRFLLVRQVGFPVDMVRHVDFNESSVSEIHEAVTDTRLVVGSGLQLTEGRDGNGAVDLTAGDSRIALGEDWGTYIHKDSTFSLWFSTTQLGRGSYSGYSSPQILGLGRGYPDVHWGWFDQDGRICAMRATHGVLFTPAKSKQSVHDGLWHHFAVSREKNSGEIKLYVDGVFQSSAMGERGSEVFKILYLGGQTFSDRSFRSYCAYRGKLDDVRLFDRVLSEEEIAGLARVSLPSIPVAVNDTFSLGNQSVGLVNVLRNDISLDGHDGLRVVGVTQGNKGSVEILPDHSLRYTAGSSFSGSDTFKYTMEGGSGVHIATATVTVSSNGHLPPVARDDYRVTGTGQAIRLDLSSNDTDSDGQPLHMRWVSEAEHGAVTQNSAGDYVYTPNESFLGVEALMYTAEDQSNGVAEASVYVTVLDAGAAINHESLTAFWRFDGNSRDTAPYGSVNDSGITNASITFVTDKERGTVLELSRLGVGVSVPSGSADLYSKDEGHSVSLWFKADDVHVRQVIFENGREDSTHPIGVNMYIDAGKLYMGTWRHQTWMKYMQRSIQPKRWYHAVFVFNKKQKQFTGFLNGQWIWTIELAWPYDVQSYGAGIGGIYNNTWFHDGIVMAADGHGFGGRISTVRFFNRVVSREEVQALSSETRMKGRVATPADHDADGLQDAWERKYFNGDVSPDTHGDGDKFTNREEYIIGSDPTRTESSFEIAAENKADASSFIVKWTSVSNRIYSVYWTDGLDHGFDLLKGGIEYPQTEYTNTVQQEGTRFYKVDVQLKDESQF